MDTEKFITLAKNCLNTFYLKQGLIIDREDMYVVWLSKTLQNNKALLSTNTPDGRYFEVTYNGDKNEVYFDAYVKEKNELFIVSEE